MSAPAGEGGLAREAAGGVLWLSLAGLVGQALTFASGILVARHLGEEEYGAAAMAMVVVSLGSVFLGFGMAPAIVSGRLSAPCALLSAHSFLALGGLAAAGLVAAAGPFASRFFDNPDLTGLLAVASFILLLGAWEVVPLAALQAARRFDRLAAIAIAGQVAWSLAAIAMAVLGAGVWALVVPPLLNAGIRAGAATACSPILLRPRLRFAEVRPHVREFLHVTGTAVTDYLFFSADKAVVGRLLGTGPLGRYNFAQSLVSRSLYAFSRTFGNPLLASLGRLRDDPARFDRAVVRASLAIARLAFPLALGGALLAPELVGLLVGEKWIAAVDLVRIFFVLGAIQAVGQLSGPVWLALGKSRLVFLWSATTNVALVGVLFLGAWTGSSEGVALAFAVYASLVLAPLCVWVTRRSCGIPLRGLGRGLLAVLRDALGMGLSVVATDRALAGTGIQAWALLAIQILVGAAVYLFLFRWISSAELASLLSVLPRPARRVASSFFRLDAAA